MGPRNTRRLATAGIGLGVIGAIVAVVLLTRSATHPQSNHRQIATIRAKLVAGMSAQQVLRLVGKPMTKRGRCWEYLEKLDPRLAAKGVVRSDTGVCFFDGRVTDFTFQDYARRHGKLVPLPPPGR
jgi:hypothetical protein